MSTLYFHQGRAYERLPETQGCKGCAFTFPSHGCREAPDCSGVIYREVAFPSAPKPDATVDSSVLAKFPITCDTLTVNSVQPEKPTNPKDAIATDKLPMHLVSPIVKAYQAISHFLGNVKYGAWNYRGAGVRYSVYKAALDRHLDAWWEGEEIDPVDGTPHLANALACINILIEGKYTEGSVDDRPPSRADVLRKLRADFEALMPQIRERYKDKAPKHWSIADTAAA